MSHLRAPRFLGELRIVERISVGKHSNSSCRTLQQAVRGPAGIDGIQLEWQDIPVTHAEVDLHAQPPLPAYTVQGATVESLTEMNSRQAKTIRALRSDLDAARLQIDRQRQTIDFLTGA